MGEGMSKEGKTRSAVGAKPARAKPRPTRKPRPRRLPPFNVILLDDDDHSYEYVVRMLAVLFAYPAQKGFSMATEVDKTGRVIVMTTHRELAELKRDQILAFGKDELIDGSAGSMSAMIEAAK